MQSRHHINCNALLCFFYKQFLAEQHLESRATEVIKNSSTTN